MKIKNSLYRRLNEGELVIKWNPKLNTLEDRLIQEQLLLNAAFQYETMKQENKAELFLSQGQSLFHDDRR